MPYQNEVTDITAYAFDSSKPDGDGSLEESLEQLLKHLGTQPARWPVHNREDREAIAPLKRAIIHKRDGNVCRICGTGGHVLTVDHIIPRSAFTIPQLRIADRSDNLISACWDCNMEKSNYESMQRKRLGVTVSCWDCNNSLPDDEWHEEFSDRPEMTIQAFCGRCGVTRVPGLNWIL